MFFHLYSQSIVNGDYYLSDLNWRILRLYEVIRDDLKGLLKDLLNHLNQVSASDLNFVLTANMTKAKLVTTPQWASLYKDLETYFYHLRKIEDIYSELPNTDTLRGTVWASKFIGNSNNS